MRVVAVLIALASLSRADHPCDDEHAAHCPAEGPATLGACLRQETLSEKCAAWVAMHDACEAELAGYCSNACDGASCGYANEAASCLTKWTNPREISDGCRASFPPEEVKVERVQSEKAKARSAKRRAVREAAAERLRKMQAGEHVEAEKADGPAAALPSGEEL
mmetsp:Transcript_18619/g.55089  ORF Transcript_18619/g.55089 Transcript_18619/m.55089 type:complete len:164 (+) Transcript_18619:278-769(+)